jgi:hypothetical protein
MSLVFMTVAGLGWGRKKQGEKHINVFGGVWSKLIK